MVAIGGKTGNGKWGGFHKQMEEYNIGSWATKNAFPVKKYIYAFSTATVNDNLYIFGMKN